MDKVAHEAMYVEFLSMVKEASEKRKRPLVGVPGGAILGALAGGYVGKGVESGVQKSLKRQHITSPKLLALAKKLMGSGKLVGAVAGAGLGGHMAYENYKKNYKKAQDLEMDKVAH